MLLHEPKTLFSGSFHSNRTPPVRQDLGDRPDGILVLMVANNDKKTIARSVTRHTSFSELAKPE